MKLLLFILCLLFAGGVRAAEHRDEHRTWLGIFARKNIAPNYDVWAETQLRHDETNQTMNQTLNRFGPLKTLSEHHEVGALMVFVQGRTLREYRPTLQHVYKDRFGMSAVSLRNRLEFRDVEDDDANAVRFRTQLRWSSPLTAIYDLVLWDEPFVNLTRETWTGNRFFERNRAFAGTRISFEKISFEVGYMNQYIPRTNRDLSEHILVLYTYF
jgi:hypothetical protein